MANSKNTANVLVGTTPNDGQGDLLRDAFVKINSNFTSLYNNGQFLANTDSKAIPGYAWENDRNTGFHNPEGGTIAASLNGSDFLILKSNGFISWRGTKLTTQTDLDNAILAISGGATGNTTISALTGIPVVDILPTTGNSEGRLVLWTNDYQIYIYTNGEWILLKEQLAPNASSGIDIVNTLPAVDNWEGRTVLRTSDETIYIFRNDAWVQLLNYENPTAGIDVVGSLPTTGNFEGRQVLLTTNDRVYIFVDNQWQAFNLFINPTEASLIGVEIVDALPSTGNFEGRQVLLTTDNQLYLYKNGAWDSMSNYLNPTATSIPYIPIVGTLPTEDNFDGRMALLTTDNQLYVFKSFFGKFL